MKVIVQTASDRYVFPEADFVEIENTTTLLFEPDKDLPGTVITEIKKEAK